MSIPSLPTPELLRQQAAWLAPARARLLRRAQIAQRRRVLDLACGPGAVTGELVRRCGGTVVALDSSAEALSAGDEAFAGAQRVRGDARHIPLADASFDLVFCQLALMWLDLPAVLDEIDRVLVPGGAMVALEPDYGGVMEYPPEIATGAIWREALVRAGADPLVGRKLPVLLDRPGWTVHVELLDRLRPPSPVRFELLRGLPLTDEERAEVDRIEAADAACGDRMRVVHLPMFLVVAEKRLAGGPPDRL
jgi:SAM-dependent methyltransferase